MSDGKDVGGANALTSERVLLFAAGILLEVVAHGCDKLFCQKCQVET
jgi:hypothetical protein